MAAYVALPPLETAIDGSAESMPRPGASPVPRSVSPPADGSDNEDLVLYGDQDDAQSIIQPAMSPVATRLTSPKTPAAEKAAALENLSGGDLFDSMVSGRAQGPARPSSMFFSPTTSSSAAPLSPRKLSKRSPYEGRERGMTLGQLPASQPLKRDFPSPWQSGPKDLVVKEPPQSTKGAMASAIGGQARSRRASSMGENALKRLSRALDSITIPTHLIPTLSTPSFLSPTPSPRDLQPSSLLKLTPPPVPERSPNRQPTLISPFNLPPPQEDPSLPFPELPGPPRRPSAVSKQSYRLRRSMSNDSLLYNSLSRVSSFGDDDRFVNVREQINSRLKAIMDSWDGPSFKLPQLPQLPNILPGPLRKQPSLSPDSSPDMRQSGSVRNPPREAPSTLDSLLASLTGDVVIMGGYRGSILRSAQGPPHRRLWAPVKVGLNIRKVDLEVGLDPEDEENMEKHIFSSGMLQNIGPVDISRRLFKKLRDSENVRNGKLRIHDYGYDWRLNPHLLSRKLVQFLEKLPSNSSNAPADQKGALVIAHSLGGVITRHAVNQRPELFSGVVFAGAPQRCINILGPIRNGDAVMLNEKVLTAQVNFSLRTSFVFLPEDGYCFVDKHTKEEYRIDFYDVNNWIKYRLSPCIGEPVAAMPRHGPLSSLLNLPDLALRSRSNSQTKNGQAPARGAEQTSNVFVEAARRATADFAVFKDRTLAPQMHSSSAWQEPAPSPPLSSTLLSGRLVPGQERHLEYLTRTLAETKRFRSELAHRPEHQAVNTYPPMAVIYGKDTPTTAGAKVTSREAIPSSEAYDELFFGSGDGVVLAKEAMLPPGYELVKGGRVCTDRGHISILGDLVAVGRAMEAIVRGRKKGIGMGPGFGKERRGPVVPQSAVGLGIDNDKARESNLVSVEG
ncbi:hypothetical protein GQ53DRAFT_765618 [Thozetella sp. PMI_491]|nr:hypothetical protein GQ53DRAFT_765618 [Thozetella sp. PMI_491]